MTSISRLAQPFLKLPQSPLHQIPTIGFHVLNKGELIEEEKLPHYSPTQFFPVNIGDVLNARYQVVGKLGYGGNSTAWLSRDLK
jgi:serine/threonine-protein kinase SRPK3